MRAGLAARDAVLATLDARRDGDPYRIDVHFVGADPREALRERADLSPDEVQVLRARLARLDRASRHGPWTRAALRLIDAQPPGTHAADLASHRRRETLVFKVDVRKLKALGLTESLGIGYRLSPRGRAVLAQLGT